MISTRPIRPLLVHVLALAMLLLGLALIGSPEARAEYQPVGVPGQWVQTFGDEFEGTQINTSIWTPEWGEGGAGAISNRCTLRSNVSQSGGFLHIKIQPWNTGCPADSLLAKDQDGIYGDVSGGAIESNPSDLAPGHTGYSYLYGYVQWTAYIPGWDGSSTCAGTYAGCIFNLPQLWSFSASGQRYNGINEFDVMEGLADPKDTISHTESGKACFHYHLWADHETQQGECAKGTKNYAGWHTFGLDWEPGRPLNFYYDGQFVGSISPVGLGVIPQYLIASNLSPGHGESVLNVAPADLKIDSVRVWQHPVLPEVTTGSATNVDLYQATINGSVDPNKWGTHYQFQYGTTTSYGSVAPEGDAGAGDSPVPVSATLSGLSEGTTYHYRLVGRNAAGYSYGSDQTFTTRSLPQPPSKWAIFSGGTANNPNQWIYYRGTGNQIFQWNWFGSKWVNAQASTTAAASNTSPTALAYGGTANNPYQVVYYQGNEHQIRQWFWNGSTSTNGVLSGQPVAANTSPTAVLSGGTANNPNQWVYYVGENNQIWQWNWFGTKWTNAQATTQPAAVGTSPTALAYGGSPGNPYQVVYYQGSDHNVWQWFWNGTSSSNAMLSSSSPWQPVAAGTSPAAVAYGGTANNPNQWVYYTGADGQIWQWNWFGSKWTNAQATTQAAAAGTSPTAAAYGGTPENPYQAVYYIGADKQIKQWFWNGSSSTNGTLGAGQPAATDVSPTVITYGGTANNPYQVVYYKGTDGQIWQWFWNGSSWKNGVL